MQRADRFQILLAFALLPACAAACGGHTYDSVVGVVVAAVLVAVFTGFGIGANDVANAFGTSVGSKSISLRTACAIASVMEFGGAMLMGDAVTKTIKGKILDNGEYTPPVREERVNLMLGFLSVEIATAIWLVLATYFRLPVSTTHTVIGGLLGFGLSTRSGAVEWSEVTKIIIAWVTAPVLSACIGAAVFYTVRLVLLRRIDSYRYVSQYMWAVVACCLWVVFTFLSVKSPPDMERAFDDAFGSSTSAGGFFARLGVSLGVSLAVTLPAQIWILPRIKRGVDSTAAGTFPWSYQPAPDGIELPNPASETAPIATEKGKYGDAETLKEHRQSLRSFHDDDLTASRAGGPTGHLERAYQREDVVERHRRAELFDERTEGLFSYLQVLTACFFSFAHGASDTANAIGPLVAIWFMHRDGVIGDKDVPAWIPLVGGAGLVLGLCLWGWRIIQSIGIEMIKITPARGFSIEMGAAIVVMLSTVLGIPTSTTHCAVGATVGCGLLEGRRDAVNAKLLVKIFCGWGVTLVISAGTSAAVYQVFKAAMC
eukprot:TRINITY_DN47455_c0_g1_i1.p1 TRINITY_DN47455_c0_g1~~TRINITY_DN47455_c0_g1_i1.p1  ORF type:complete len:542 (+),score=119.37 TRINITY_DN47455_c0_g1_i1:76-1701(+)